MNTDPSTKPANKRGAARLAAVQAIYQMDIADTSMTEIVEEYETLRIGREVDGDEYLNADIGWFRTLVSGVVREQKVLDPAIHKTLPDDWPLSRIDTLLRSVLRCGVFELEHKRDVPAKVVIAEYIEIAKAFFEDDEPRIVNAVLDSLARDLRSGETDDRQADEFEIIERYFAPLASKGSFAFRDDAALLDVPPGMTPVVTQDAIAEGVHFFPDDPPNQIAKKALRVNLSDLAAKGARPSSVSLALGLGKSWNAQWIEAFARGLGEDCEMFGVELSGGDTFSTGSGFVVSMTAIGHVVPERYVSRLGARIGDHLMVTGTIGDGALGLRVRSGELDLGTNHNAFLINRYLEPQPRTELIEMIRANANAAMDVSDGLVGDAGKLANSSDVAITIKTEQIPLSDAALNAVDDDPALLEAAISGGDDYELLFAVAPEDVPQATKMAQEAGVSVATIGAVVKGEGVTVFDSNGNEMQIACSGYNHARPQR